MEGNRNNVASSRDIVAIMLARDYPTADIGQSNRLYIEPLPELDYDLIYNLLSLRRAQGYTRELTCCDLLVKSRKLYYKIQRDFQGVFYALQDSYSHSTLLDQENERLKKAGPIKASQLLYNENERQRNSQTLRHYLEKFDHLHNKRETTTKHFSRMKVNFIKYDMPQLIAIGKAAYSQATNCQGKKTPLVLHNDLKLLCYAYLLK